MKLYNTLNRQVNELQPLTPGKVSFYSCGPTVYHYYHIGNLRNAVFVDTLKRILEASDLKVSHIMNITDVGHLTSDGDEGEDKLQEQATKQKMTVWEVAEYYTKAFKRDMQLLNVISPSEYITATSAIPTQIKMVQTLLDKGFAYQTEQAIYFDVTKLDDYGKLSGQNLKDKETGARDEVVTDPNKKNPWDFALWFFTVGHFKDHEMRWETPWGEGFPGWHLECSAIIEQELGASIDIHSGGVDHIGTHHTNEIAQSEAAHDGAPLANNWFHVEFLLVDGGKMSKSLGNSYTLQDVLDKQIDPLALRLFYLQSHYRTQQNFTWKALEAAQNRLKALGEWADLAHQNLTAEDGPNFKEAGQQLLKALQNDLDTPVAFQILAAVVSASENGQINSAQQADFIKLLDQLFGLNLGQRPDITPEQKTLITERESARQAKDFAAADKARDALSMQGIELRDTPAGALWYRAN